MIQIDKQLIRELFDKAVVNPRLRMNFDLRTSPDDGGQRMLNALMPGTVVSIHRHPMSNESVICLSGKLVEVLEPSVIFEAKDGKYGEDGSEVLIIDY